VSPRTRAVLVVSPNNPTGSYLHRDDLARSCVCAPRHDLALIGDEVFFDYPLEPAPHATSVLAQAEVLTVALGGLSKSGGLPQVKLGWMAWSGPRHSHHGRCTPMRSWRTVTCRCPHLSRWPPPGCLHDVMPIRRQIHTRVRDNLRQLRDICAAWPALTPYPVEGGWSAVVQVPAMATEQELVLNLLQEDGVLVHPGYFFDFPREAFLVVSLLLERDVVRRGIGRLRPAPAVMPA
jgi:alanine-synthesizing transaminase